MFHNNKSNYRTSKKVAAPLINKLKIVIAGKFITCWWMKIIQEAMICTQEESFTAKRTYGIADISSRQPYWSSRLKESASNFKMQFNYKILYYYSLVSVSIARQEILWFWLDRRLLEKAANRIARGGKKSFNQQIYHFIPDETNLKKVSAKKWKWRSVLLCIKVLRKPDAALRIS